MSTNARRLAIAALGAAVVAVAAIVLTGGGDGYTIRAEFKDVGGLRKNSSVKVAGVPAGKVTDIEVTPRDTAIATLRIDKSAAPIGRGASVNVRPTDLLGERYAELSQGDTSKPMASGSLISIRRTGVPVELDDILNTLDADTRTRLGIVVSELGRGLNGRGQDLSNVLAVLPPSLQQTQKLVDEVNTQNAALKAVIVKGDRITATVNGRRDDMGKLIDEAAAALTTVAEKRRDLGAAVENAPATLAELRTTLANLSSASDQLRPAAVELRAAAAPLNSTLKALPDFADQAAPTLDTATKVAPTLAHLGRAATPTVKRLVVTSTLLNGVLEPAKPLLAHMDRRGTDDLLYFISNMVKGLQGRDGISHFIGAHFYLNSEYIANAINAFNGVHSSRKARHKGLDALPNVALPKVKLPDAVKKVLPNKLPDVKPIVKHVTHQVAPLVNKLPGAGGNVTDQVAGKVQPPPLPGGRGSGHADALSLFNYLMGN
jgi:virulence factor Mce-like protein